MEAEERVGALITELGPQGLDGNAEFLAGGLQQHAPVPRVQELDRRGQRRRGIILALERCEQQRLLRMHRLPLRLLVHRPQAEATRPGRGLQRVEQRGQRPIAGAQRSDGRAHMLRRGRVQAFGERHRHRRALFRGEGASAGAKLRVRAVLRMALASRLNRLIERQQTQEAVDGVRTARAQHVLGEVGGLCLVCLEELRPACGVLQRRPAAPDFCLQRGASAAAAVGARRERRPSALVVRLPGGFHRRLYQRPCELRRVVQAELRPQRAQTGEERRRRQRLRHLCARRRLHSRCGALRLLLPAGRPAAAAPAGLALLLALALLASLAARPRIPVVVGAGVPGGAGGMRLGACAGRLGCGASAGAASGACGARARLRACAPCGGALQALLACVLDERFAQLSRERMSDHVHAGVGRPDVGVPRGERAHELRGVGVAQTLGQVRARVRPPCRAHILLDTRVQPREHRGADVAVAERHATRVARGHVRRGVRHLQRAETRILHHAVGPVVRLCRLALCHAVYARHPR